MLSRVRELCMLNGVSSFEDAVRSYIMEQARPYATTMRVDAMGNLIVFKKGEKAAPNRLMLCAHMDEVGLIVKRITEDGYLKFAAIGGIDRRVLIGKRVLVGEGKTPGVIGLKAIHLTTRAEREKLPKLEEFYIDIGASTQQEAEEKTFIGDFAAFDSDCVEFGEGLFKAKAIDDRIGCAVMLRLLEEDLPVDCTFAFTVQEEVGTRGAFGAAFSVAPEIALVLEGTTAADSPTTAGHKQVCAPGKGPVISLMDGATIYDRALFDLLRSLAEKNQIPWQTKHYIAGGNDAKAIQRTKAGVRVAAVSAAVRYLHAPSSVASIKDFDHMYALSKKFVDAIAAQE